MTEQSNNGSAARSIASHLMIATEENNKAKADNPNGFRTPPPPEMKKKSMKMEVAAPAEQQEFLIPELIPAKDICLFIGEDGIGKTQFAAQLCTEIMFSHSQFLGFFNLNTKHKRAMYIATEDAIQRFRGAISRQMTGLYPAINLKDPDSIQGDFDFLDASDYYDWDDFIENIEREVPADYYDLIVADALSDLFTYIDGEINSNTHARRILSELKNLCVRKNTTLLLLHHAAKTKISAKAKEGKFFLIKNDSQGAGAITQKPRTVIALTHDSGSVQDEEGNETPGHEGRLSTHINYLHVLKANLMGRRYMRSAVALRFKGSSLLHEYMETVELQPFEGADLAQNLQNMRERTLGGQKRNIMPGDIPDEEHIIKISRIFAMVDYLDSMQLLSALQFEYGISERNAEKNFRPFLSKKGFITLDKKADKWTCSITETPF